MLTVVQHSKASFCLLLLMLAAAPGCATIQRVQLPWQRSWEGFSHPTQHETGPRLLALHGYEPGKIPVIFIHGLMSDHSTWDVALEQFEQDPWLCEHYQFWTYHYPSGNSYLQTAAELRTELATTLATIDPQQRDPALNEIVLVGHSMGGLLAKLQVTTSGESLWHTISERPLAEVATEADDRERLARAVYFTPLPQVKRVVFIATPHAGSQWTERPIGYLGRSMIEFPAELQAKYHDFLLRNKSVLREPAASIPTSIDHLAPDSPVMLATAQLPVAPGVTLHSIVGTGYREPDWSLGDGVVSETSSHLENVVSELKIGASHSFVHQQPEAATEITRILHEHYRALSTGKK